MNNSLQVAANSLRAQRTRPWAQCLSELLTLAFIFELSQRYFSALRLGAHVVRALIAKSLKNGDY